MRVVYLDQDHFKPHRLFTEHCCNLIKLRCTLELGKVGQYCERVAQLPLSPFFKDSLQPTATNN